MLLGPAAPAELLDPGPGRLVDRVVDHRGLVPAALRGADVAVNLHGSGPESHALLAAATPRRLVAFAAAGHPDGPSWDPDEHERDRWCRLTASAGWPGDPADVALPAPPPPTRGAGATLVHPGAASPGRRWPAERFAAVARAEAERGREVLVTGSAAERDLALAVADGAGLADDAVVAGRTDLPALAALVAHAGALVSGDTGIAHLASAYGTPSVTLFGPTPPAAWGPPADPRHVVLWPAPAGYRGDPHATAVDPVLARIGVEDVTRGLRALGRRPSR